ncbi:S-adenosyl-L-methionine dependent methyltransferase [Trametes gibbosa]|nr:S-adenosyl-L-methionine dependent methyltransferase [Trametes gibbosa]
MHGQNQIQIQNQNQNQNRTPPDFLALARAHPPLTPHIIRTPNGPTIDFKNDASQRALTEAILLHDFAIRVSLPPTRLCPPVPNRLNYILWLHDLARLVSLALGQDPPPPAHALDIGTGASAIYPLLGCRTCPEWTFVATDIDELSLQSARDNVRQNGLQDRIDVRKADPAAPILAPLLESDGPSYDFTMCNPPFYGSREEVQQSAEAKETGPHAVCTGADVEMITPGGEAAFVIQMVNESLQARDRCRWFTSMLGKMSSLTDLVQTFRNHNIDNYATTELVQGHTRRWVIAWSFSDIRLPDSLARLSHPGIQHLMPPRNTLCQPLPRAHSAAHASTAICATLASISGLRTRSTAPPASDSPLDAVLTLTTDTWSRAARRRTQRQMDVDARPPPSPSLVCRIRCEARPPASLDAPVSLVFDWLRGRDRALFESFASHVGRKVGVLLSNVPAAQAAADT